MRASIAAADVVFIHVREADAKIVRTAGADLARETEQQKAVLSSKIAQTIRPELSDLLLGRAPGRRSDRDITLFLNYAGLGYQFAATGHVIYTKARERGLGSRARYRPASQARCRRNGDFRWHAFPAGYDGNDASARQGGGSCRSFAQDVVRRLWLVASLAVLPLGPAAGADGYYKGKTITFVIGSAAGGGYDTYSRLIAQPYRADTSRAGPRSYRRTCPARAASVPPIISTTSRRKDGTVIGMVDRGDLPQSDSGAEPDRRTDHWIGGSPNLGRRAKADATKFNWIGRILANSAVLFARSDASGAEDRRCLRQGADRFHLGDGIQVELDRPEERARHEVHDHIRLSGKRREPAGHAARRGRMP